METPKKDKNNKKQKYYLAIIIIGVLLFISTFVILFMNQQNKTDEKELAYTNLIKEINDGNVEKIEMTIGSTTVKAKIVNNEEEKEVIVPSTQAFVEMIQTKVENGNNIELIQKQQNIFVRIAKSLMSFLPTILLVVLFVLIWKMQGLGEKGKVYDADTKNTKIRFDDVAGLEEEKQEMIEIVNFLKNPSKFYDMGAKVPRRSFIMRKTWNRKDFNRESYCRRSRCSIYINEWFRIYRNVCRIRSIKSKKIV